MPIYGPFTGDPKKSKSYLYGPHWKNSIGYRVIKGNSNYKHQFGGSGWKVPYSDTCKESYHQILTIDLTDPKVKELEIEGFSELPLITHLNSSVCWSTQVYKLDSFNKNITIIKNYDTQHWFHENRRRISSPLPKLNVILKDMEDLDNPVDEITYYKIFDSYGLDYIFRLLGAPLLVTGPLDYECPICHKEMIYVGSLISENYGIDHLFDNIDLFLGEICIYFLICKHCHILKVESQGT